jgi:hypothetical protein
MSDDHPDPEQWRDDPAPPGVAKYFVDIDSTDWVSPGGANSICNLFVIFGRSWWPNVLWRYAALRSMPSQQRHLQRLATERSGLRLRPGSWRFVTSNDVPETLWTPALRLYLPTKPVGRTYRAVLMWMLMD